MDLPATRRSAVSTAEYSADVALNGRHVKQLIEWDEFSPRGGEVEAMSWLEAHRAIQRTCQRGSATILPQLVVQTLARDERHDVGWGDTEEIVVFAAPTSASASTSALASGVRQRQRCRYPGLRRGLDIGLVRRFGRAL